MAKQTPGPLYCLGRFKLKSLGRNQGWQKDTGGGGKPLHFTNSVLGFLNNGLNFFARLKIILEKI